MYPVCSRLRIKTALSSLKTKGKNFLYLARLSENDFRVMVTSFEISILGFGKS